MTHVMSVVHLNSTQEYPKMSPDFPVDLGWCQVGSPLAYSKLAMLRRNFLFARCQDGSGRLACLDLMEERCLRALVHPDLAPLGTTWEGDFGDPLCTIVYLKPRGKGHGVLLLD